jgi:hypothetical protein
MLRTALFSFVLGEWTPATNEDHVWWGTCKDAHGNPMAFGIHVDPLWTPSQ